MCRVMPGPRATRGRRRDRPLRVTVLEHAAEAPAGWLGEALERAGADVRTVRLHAGDPLPELGTADAVVILGGPMGAYEEDAHPILVDEKHLVRRAHASSIPVLGICLGSQIVADALGGRAFLASTPQYGFLRAELTPSGRGDPVVGHLDGEVLGWHQDTFELPPGATLLARSDRYPEAFRLGRTLGLQFHAEATPAALERWVAGTSPERLRAAGFDPEVIMAEAHRRRDQLAASAARLFDAWIGQLRESRQ